MELYAMKNKLAGKEKEIIEQYQNGNSCSKISKRYCCSPEAIRLCLKKNNSVLRKKSSFRKWKVDEDYFSNIVDERQAWLLGFIIADGSISNDNGGYFLSIDLAKKDAEILRKIRKILASDCPIKLTKRNSVRFRFSCKKLFKDLVKYGVLVNKTKNGTPDLRNIIPAKLHRHLLRGAFDGDGWIAKGKSRSALWGVAGHYSFLQGLVSDMCRYCNIAYPSPLNRKTKNGYIYQWQIGGVNQLGRIYNFLYKDATIWLNRKKAKLEKESNENVDDKS